MDTSDTAPIRELITSHPLQRELQRDRESWTRLCRAVDAIEDLPSHSQERFNALNVLRTELGMESVVATGDEIPSAIKAALTATKAELEERVNTYHEAHSTPLLPFFQNIDYSIEKIRSAVRAFLPGGYRDNLEMDRIHIATVESTLNTFLQEVHARDYDAAALSDAEDALYVVQLAQALVAGEPSIVPRDTALLASYALPPLIESSKGLAAEIDEATNERQTGWLPPAEP